MVRPVVSSNDGKYNRLTGGRLAASVLMMLAMMGTMVTFLNDAGYAQEDWGMPIFAAAVIGLMAG